jgi:DNA-binding ferritin-like protein
MKINEFLSVLFEVRINAHISHLQTGSYAAHKALDELYNGIVDYTDRIAETYQGDTKTIITKYPQIKIVEGLDFVKYLKETVDNSRTFRKEIEQEEIKAIVDELIEFLNSIIYKLNFLE